MTAELSELAPLALAQAALDEAATAVQAAEDNVEAARSRVHELRDRARAGEKVKSRQVTDASAEVEHAELVLEGAQGRRETARAALHEARVDDALERHHRPPADAVRQAQAVLQLAARDLGAAVAQFNTYERRTFNEVAALGVPGYTSPVAHPSTHDLAKLVANAVHAGTQAVLQQESGEAARGFMSALNRYAAT